MNYIGWRQHENYREDKQGGVEEQGGEKMKEENLTLCFVIFLLADTAQRNSMCG